MTYRADALCFVFLTLIWPILWTRLENWMPALQHFCLHMRGGSQVLRPGARQSLGTSFQSTGLWSRLVGLGKTQRSSCGPSAQLGSMLSPFPRSFRVMTPINSRASGTQPTFYDKQTGIMSVEYHGIMFVECPCEMCRKT